MNITEHPDVIINADITESESDEEETDIGYHGYQALGQEITTAADSEDDDEVCLFVNWINVNPSKFNLLIRNAKHSQSA